jgi:REP element-mobilizing transposase RayT
MKYDPKIHHRRSIRLKNYDYSQAGFYFVTIVTQNRECLFGDIVDGEMVLNDAGNVVKKCWDEIPSHYPHIKLYEFVIMPNHIHGIVGAENIPPVQKNIPPVQNGIARAENIPPIQKNPPLGNVIKGFKIGVTKWFQAEKNHPIGKSIWQRNYWEHIIRNENEYQRIAQYIINNPQKWSLDKLNGGAGNQVMEPPAMYGQKIFYPNDKAWMV